MKSSKKWLLPLMILVVSGAWLTVQSQTKFSAKSNISMSVSGTSTMHDWVMKSTTGDCSATFVEDASGKLTDITGLSFTVSSKALKSGKDAMDKNAYKALKADKNPNISASLKSAEVTTKDNKTYMIKAIVQLTIAGKTLETELNATAKHINDNSYSISGEKKISMKEYGMDPPSFMLGAVKTGNDVNIHFDVVLNK